MLTDGLEWCGLLRCFYQLAYWRHPFTAEDPLVIPSDVMLQFLQTGYHEERNLPISWKANGIFVWTIPSKYNYILENWEL